MYKHNLNDLTPRIQRIMMKLQRNYIHLTWTPGKYMYVADTLSRSTTKVKTNSSTEKDVDMYVNMVFATLPATLGQLQKISEATDKDPVLCKVKQNL